MESKTVWLVIDSTFDVGGKDETSLTLYTEGNVAKIDGAYTYDYDESQLYNNPVKIHSTLIVGDTFVSRALSGDLNYVMRFEEGLIDSVFYQSAEASFVTQIETLELSSSIEGGLGTVDILYQISFAQSQSMINRVSIRISGGQA